MYSVAACEYSLVSIEFFCQIILFCSKETVLSKCEPYVSMCISFILKHYSITHIVIPTNFGPPSIQVCLLLTQEKSVTFEVLTFAFLHTTIFFHCLYKISNKSTIYKKSTLLSIIFKNKK